MASEDPFDSLISGNIEFPDEEVCKLTKKFFNNLIRTNSQIFDIESVRQEILANCEIILKLPNAKDALTTMLKMLDSKIKEAIDILERNASLRDLEDNIEAFEESNTFLESQYLDIPMLRSYVINLLLTGILNNLLKESFPLKIVEILKYNIRFHSASFDFMIRLNTLMEGEPIPECYDDICSLRESAEKIVILYLVPNLKLCEEIVFSTGLKHWNC
jgi:hypothetical protein